MFAGDVVEHEVETEADAVAAGGRRQRLQVVDRPEVGAHGAVVGDGVAAVVGARARLQQRHQVEVGHAQLLQVRQVLADAAQVTGEPVGVGGVPEHPRVLEPVRFEQALQVEPLELAVAVDEPRRRRLDESAAEVGDDVWWEHLVQPGTQVRPPANQPGPEHLRLVIGDATQVGRRGEHDLVGHRLRHRALTAGK